jgi:NAD(P)-dependent dehydrogenase (short-subunit alcohol dehydrogenase family)
MTVEKTLAGKVALVTGAGRGLGRAHALTLAESGAAVVLNDVGRDVQGLGSEEPVAEAVALEIRQAGGRCAVDTSDISTFEGAAAAVRTAQEQFGALDILVNNAGVLGDAPVTEVEAAQIARVFGVHFIGTVGTMRAALPGMRARGWGRVVNTVSEVALTSRPGGGGFVYAAAKAAIWSTTLSVAAEYHGTGVTVNGVSPGARTRMSADTIDASPSSRSMNLDPVFVARAVRYLASEAGADITGQIIHVAGVHVREYLPVRRAADTELVQRIAAAVRSGG